MANFYNIIRCDQLKGQARVTYDNLPTDICGIDRFKYISTCVCICMLIIGCVCIWRKYEKYVDKIIISY